MKRFLIIYNIEKPENLDQVKHVEQKLTAKGYEVAPYEVTPVLCESAFFHYVLALADVSDVLLFGDWYTSSKGILLYKLALEEKKGLWELGESGELVEVDPLKIGMKLSEKPAMELVDLSFMLNIARVLTYGLNKYGKDSWKNVPDGFDRYRGAILRHLTALSAGELMDNETGLPHTAHIGANAMFLEYFINQKIKGD